MVTDSESQLLSSVIPQKDEADLRSYWHTEYVRIDRLFIKILIVQFIGLISVALFYTPTTWIGEIQRANNHIYGSLTIALLAVIIAMLLVLSRAGSRSSRYVIAIAQMALSGVFIHLSGGRVEAHFHILGSLAFLSFYKDWRVLVMASVFAFLDTGVREMYWPQSVFGVAETNGFRWMEHTWWIIFEDSFLISFCIGAKRETERLIAAESSQKIILGNIKNIVQNKTTALSQSVEELDRLAFIVKNTDNVVFMLNQSGDIEWVNDAFVSLYDKSIDEVLHTSYVELMRLDELDMQSLSIIEVFVEQHMSSMGDLVTIRNRPEGRKFYEHEFLVRESESGKKEMVIIEKDRTQGMLAHERARVAFEESEMIMDSFSGGVVGVDSEGVIFKWEANAINYLGLGKSDAVGRCFLDLSVGINMEKMSVFIAQYMSDPMRAKNTIELPSEGVEAGSSMLLFNIHDIKSGSHRGGYILVSINVTERKSLERQLYHAQKMEAVGQLAAGVAHEINTPIQFIGDNLRFFKDSFDDINKFVNDCGIKIKSEHPDFVDDFSELLAAADFDYLSTEVPEAVDQSLEGVDRVAKIIRAMKDFSHPGENEKDATDIATCIQGAVTMAKNEYKYCADVQMNIVEELPPVQCNKNEIIQVMLILVVNASHAVQDVLNASDVERGLIEIHARQVGEEIAISVKDSGTGIDKDIQEKIFEAFFTTKEVGKGTGQGLSLAHTIVHENHGGRIELESEIGSGSTFTVFLPIGEAGTGAGAPGLVEASV